MKTWQKNKGRNNWNRKRKQLIKEAVPIQPIDKPFIITKEYPNVVTLCAEGYFSTYYGVPQDYKEDSLIKMLCGSIRPFVKFEIDHCYTSCRLDEIKYRAILRVLEPERSKLNIYE